MSAIFQQPVLPETVATEPNTVSARYISCNSNIFDDMLLPTTVPESALELSHNIDLYNSRSLSGVFNLSKIGG